MREATPTYSINDAEGFEGNLLTFSEVLAALDPQLGPVLAAQLAELSTVEAPNLHDLWDALYAATAPVADSAAPETAT
ncbi:MAG TPA: hypothetical protein VJM34_14375 [Novosphingobium sp.]|nr:hypothetical protein [Novosphingobium sp.]